MVDWKSPAEEAKISSQLNRNMFFFHLQLFRRFRESYIRVFWSLCLGDSPNEWHGEVHTFSSSTSSVANGASYSGHSVDVKASDL